MHFYFIRCMLLQVNAGRSVETTKEQQQVWEDFLVLIFLFFFKPKIKSPYRLVNKSQQELQLCRKHISNYRFALIFSFRIHHK